MTKNKDTRLAGRSKLIPYNYCEGRKARHRRRKRVNVYMKDYLHEWCKNNGWTLEIKDNGYHWILYYNQLELCVEWWPSGAKLIINKDWENGLHCYDIDQVKKTLRKAVHDEKAVRYKNE